MIFSELYSAYYNAVAAILAKAVKEPVSPAEMRKIIEKTAFEESVLAIEPALKEERWPLLYKDGSTPLRHAPSQPLTILQKEWLKAVYDDPRIRLFTDDVPDFPGIEPLFRQEDVIAFDRYADGDPYEDTNYIRNFRIILDAVKNGYPLAIDMENRYGKPLRFVLQPECVEYSEKDDKFRLIGYDRAHRRAVNVARVTAVKRFPGIVRRTAESKADRRSAVFELYDRRKALERALLHFAHFEKQVEKAEGEKYILRITYDAEDETELVIRVLSFGPMLKAKAPGAFVQKVKERIIRQKELLNKEV